jgi:uncharacterized protein
VLWRAVGGGGVSPVRRGDHTRPMTRERFLACVLQNPFAAAILDRGGDLGLPDWWLTGGGVFQTVWNVLDGRDPAAGINDYDLFYFDASDLTESGQELVRTRSASLFTDLDATIDVCNEARVHLWYGQYFDAAATPFSDTRDAIDHFISPTCMYALTRAADGDLEVYAPHGYADLFDQRVRPNPLIATREVYLAKTGRWQREWPGLTVDSWVD